MSLTENGYSDAISSETNQNGEHYGFNYFNFKLQSNQNDTEEKDNFIEYPLRLEKDTRNYNLQNSISNSDRHDMSMLNIVPNTIHFNKNLNLRKRFWSPYQLDTFKSISKMRIFIVESITK